MEIIFDYNCKIWFLKFPINNIFGKQATKNQHSENVKE
jgi:hypothetical protein